MVSVRALRATRDAFAKRRRTRCLRLVAHRWLWRTHCGNVVAIQNFSKFQKRSWQERFLLNPNSGLQNGLPAIPCEAEEIAVRPLRVAEPQRNPIHSVDDWQTINYRFQIIFIIVPKNQQFRFFFFRLSNCWPHGCSNALAGRQFYQASKRHLAAINWLFSRKLKGENAGHSIKFSSRKICVCSFSPTGRSATTVTDLVERAFDYHQTVQNVDREEVTLLVELVNKLN